MCTHAHTHIHARTQVHARTCAHVCAQTHTHTHICCSCSHWTFNNNFRDHGRKWKAMRGSRWILSITITIEAAGQPALGLAVEPRRDFDVLRATLSGKIRQLTAERHMISYIFWSKSNKTYVDSLIGIHFQFTPGLRLVSCESKGSNHKIVQRLKRGKLGNFQI